MMSRVPRRRASRQAWSAEVRIGSGGAQRAAKSSQRRVCLSSLALAVALGATGAWAQDAAQSGKSSDAAQTQPPAKGGLKTPPGMIRYAKPVVRNGKVVLWHGPLRGAGRPTVSARPAATPPATPSITILADSSDPEARRAASEIAGVIGGDGGEAKPVMGRTSRAAMAKAVGGNSADLAVAPLDSLLDPTGGDDWRSRAPYVARLYNEDIELIAPRAIADFKQLAGRKVNVDAADSAIANTAEIVFSDLKVAANWTNYPLGEALQRLARGEIDAVVTVGLDNSDALSALGGDGRFHVLSIPYTSAMRDTYAPERLTAADSPRLIGGDEKVDTLSVPLILVAIDGAAPARADRLAPYAGRFFAKFDQLADDPKDGRWRNVNLAATVGQMPRFGAAQAWLDQNKGEVSADFEAFRTIAQAANASSEGPTAADSDRLYQSLMRLSGAGR
jgi:TRAP-type uncharacterized transport system substrate-binding protein